ncbi:MAG TPA: HTH-type transcriptional repressor FabR [Nevskiales bacterium]|nr:HTH-type transcriptional repressor FabR [Nevskiales bacterium]
MKPMLRKGGIEREQVIAAALKLLGPNRSVSTLSLREVAREAGIAPNSFYRHFRDMDELAVALIDLAGGQLRQIIREARLRVSAGGEVIRPSVEAFMEQLEAEEQLLHILLREGSVGSDAFRQAVDRELRYFEDELRDDLIRLSQVEWPMAYQPALVAKAITRLVFAMGATAMDQPRERRREITEQTIEMVRMIVVGAQTLARDAPPAR